MVGELSRSCHLGSVVSGKRQGVRVQTSAQPLACVTSGKSHNCRLSPIDRQGHWHPRLSLLSRSEGYVWGASPCARRGVSIASLSASCLLLGSAGLAAWVMTHSMPFLPHVHGMRKTPGECSRALRVMDEAVSS